MSQTPKIAGLLDTSEADSAIRLRSGSRPLNAWCSICQRAPTRPAHLGTGLSAIILPFGQVACMWRWTRLIVMKIDNGCSRSEVYPNCANG